MNKIGQYIKKLRKAKGITQQQLADTLNVSFQAVSKWETGETLPDVALLLDLCNELNTTADMLLNGGAIVCRGRKLISMANIVSGFEHLLSVKDCFGKDSTFYQGIVEGISNKMNFNFEEALETNIQVLYAEVVIQYLQNGYTVDMQDVKQYITNDRYIQEISKRIP